MTTGHNTFRTKHFIVTFLSQKRKTSTSRGSVQTFYRCSQQIHSRLFHVSSIFNIRCCTKPQRQPSVSWKECKTTQLVWFWQQVVAVMPSRCFASSTGCQCVNASCTRRRWRCGRFSRPVFQPTWKNILSDTPPPARQVLLHVHCCLSQEQILCLPDAHFHTLHLSLGTIYLLM